MNLCPKLGFYVLTFFILPFTVLTTVIPAQPTRTNSFLETARVKLLKPKSCKSVECVCSIADRSIASRLLSEYGSVFAAAETVRPPSRCIFENELQVTEFQRSLQSKPEIMLGVTIELQETAMTALLKAREEAEGAGLRISPLDGRVAGKRSYSDTVRIWNSRYFKALDHWVRRRKISIEDADTARRDTVLIQIRKVMDWENSGLNFGTNIKGSIFASTAPPGTSQHLSMLAFDVVQYSNRAVRTILNKHGWYQTVANDPPHFTYLGAGENEFPSRGLKSVKKGPYKFWVPAI